MVELPSSAELLDVVFSFTFFSLMSLCRQDVHAYLITTLCESEMESRLMVDATCGFSLSLCYFQFLFTLDVLPL